MTTRSRFELFEEMSDCMVDEDIDAGIREMMKRVCVFFEVSRGGICQRNTDGKRLETLLVSYGFDTETDVLQLVRHNQEEYVFHSFELCGDIRGFLFLERPQCDLSGRKMQETLREICRNVVIANHHRELVNQLREREQELQYAYTALMDVKEEEARRIALELHDGIGQNLTSMLLYLRLCRRESAGERLMEILEKLQLLVSQTLSETQRIVRHMRPKALEELGLVQALYWYFSEYRKKLPQLDVEYSITVPGLNLPEEVEGALYRVVIEALTNIARHAQASRVCFVMLRMEGQLTLQISDDGVGMDLATVKRKGMGLMGMQERMRKIGAEFTVESVLGQGTWIRIILPLAEISSDTQRIMGE